MTTEEIPFIVPGIIRTKNTSLAEPVLLGAACTDCQRRFFPQASICPDCFGEVEQVELGSQGRIYSFTVVRTKPPLGLPQPYAVGYIDLDGCDLRVFSLLDPAQIGKLRIDQAVRLACAQLGEDGQGNPRLRPYFTIVSGGENT